MDLSPHRFDFSHSLRIQPTPLGGEQDRGVLEIWILPKRLADLSVWRG